MTSMPGVFAGGDIVRGAATVILAMGDGKRPPPRSTAWLRRRWPPVGAGRERRTERDAPTTVSSPPA